MPRAQSYPDNHQEFSGRQKNHWRYTSFPELLLLQIIGFRRDVHIGELLHCTNNMVEESKATPNAHSEIYHGNTRNFMFLPDSV